MHGHYKYITLESAVCRGLLQLYVYVDFKKLKMAAFLPWTLAMFLESLLLCFFDINTNADLIWN